MTTKNNQPQGAQNKDFGLPNTEFSPLESGGGPWLKITAIILGFVLIIGAGVIYRFFYYPSVTDAPMETHATYEAYANEVPEGNVDTAEHNAPAAYQADKNNTTTSKFSEAVEEVSEKATKHLDPSNTTKPEKGTVTRVNTPQGCYYVVVGSFIDDDLAADYAYQLAQKGVHSMLLAPSRGKYFSRVAISKKHTFSDANEKAAALKAIYGTGIWVVKY